MISMLIGTVAGQERDDRLVVDCNGVGYSVAVGKRDRKAVQVYGKRVTIYARQVWSESMGPALFGWLSERDRAFFDRVVKVEGFGPGRAAKVVDALDEDDLRAAIETPDAAKTIAKRVDGIGVFLAARLVTTFTTKETP